MKFLASSTYDLSDPYMYETYNSAASEPSPFMVFFWLIYAVVTLVAAYKIFEKAKQPGWAAIIPIYNLWVNLKIIGRPGWWILLYLVPIVNIVISIIVAIDLAKAFGKGGAFGFFWLWLIPIVGYCMLGFGDAKYVGPVAAKK